MWAYKPMKHQAKSLFRALADKYCRKREREHERYYRDKILDSFDEKYIVDLYHRGELELKVSDVFQTIPHPPRGSSFAPLRYDPEGEKSPRVLDHDMHPGDFYFQIHLPEDDGLKTIGWSENADVRVF